MSARLILIMFVMSILGISDMAAAAVSTIKQSGKSTKQTNKKAVSMAHSVIKKIRSRHIAHRLVPPPPAFMPTILPESYYQSRSTTTKAENDDSEELAKKPINPYAKYFYSSQGAVPAAAAARSGVTTWSALR